MPNPKDAVRKKYFEYMKVENIDECVKVTEGLPLDYIINITNDAIYEKRSVAEIVKESIPAPARRTGGNPAKRTFQALRIEVNQELAVLERAIPAALNALKVGGRLVVMSYQSLEDRIVKSFFASASFPISYLKLLSQNLHRLSLHSSFFTS